MDLLVAEPGVEGASERGVLGWEKDWGFVERLWKAAFEFGSERLLGTEGGAGMPEIVIEGFEADAAGGGFIGEDDVEPVCRDLQEEVLHFSLATNDVNGLRQGEDGLEHLVGDELWEGVDDSNVESENFGAWALFDGVEHFAAEGKDFVGETKDD